MQNNRSSRRCSSRPSSAACRDWSPPPPFFPLATSSPTEGRRRAAGTKRSEESWNKPPPAVSSKAPYTSSYFPLSHVPMPLDGVSRKNWKEELDRQSKIPPLQRKSFYYDFQDRASRMERVYGGPERTEYILPFERHRVSTGQAATNSYVTQVQPSTLHRPYMHQNDECGEFYDKGQHPDTYDGIHYKGKHADPYSRIRWTVPEYERARIKRILDI